MASYKYPCSKCGRFLRDYEWTCFECNDDKPKGYWDGFEEAVKSFKTFVEWLERRR